MVFRSFAHLNDQLAENVVFVRPVPFQRVSIDSVAQLLMALLVRACYAVRHDLPLLAGSRMTLHLSHPLVWLWAHSNRVIFVMVGGRLWDSSEENPCLLLFGGKQAKRFTPNSFYPHTIHC